MATNTPLASTGWATGKGMSAASLRAMALAWAARVVQAPLAEHADPGGGEEAALGRQLAGLLQARVEAVRQGGVEQHHGFGERHAGLGPAHDQDVDAERFQRLEVEP